MLIIQAEKIYIDRVSKKLSIYNISRSNRIIFLGKESASDCSIFRGDFIKRVVGYHVLSSCYCCQRPPWLVIQLVS